MLISAYYICVKNPHGVETVTVMKHDTGKDVWVWKNFQTKNQKELASLKQILNGNMVISFGYTNKILQKYNIGYKFVDLKQIYREHFQLPPDSKFNRWQMAEKLGIETAEEASNDPFPGCTTCEVYQDIYEAIKEQQREEYAKDPEAYYKKLKTQLQATQ